MGDKTIELIPKEIKIIGSLPADQTLGGGSDQTTGVSEPRILPRYIQRSLLMSNPFYTRRQAGDGPKKVKLFIGAEFEYEGTSADIEGTDPSIRITFFKSATEILFFETTESVSQSETNPLKASKTI